MPYSFFFFETIWWIVVLSCVGFIFWIWKWGSWSLGIQIASSIITTLVLAVIFYGSFIETQKLVVREVEIESELEKPLKIGVVSDIHVGPYKKKEFVQRIVDKLNAQKPDLILIPGDFLYGDSRFISELEPLKDLSAPAYFVIGNHDYRLNGRRINKDVSLLRKQLNDWGLHEVTNESTLLRENLWLVGADDSYWGNIDLEKAFENVPAEAFTLFMAHSPDIMVNLENKGLLPALTVTGHTHGGQIRLPFVGDIPAVLPLRDKRFEKGWYPSHRIYVSSGAGESGTRARLLNPPEVVIITIKSGDK